MITSSGEGEVMIGRCAVVGQILNPSSLTSEEGSGSIYQDRIEIIKMIKKEMQMIN